MSRAARLGLAALLLPGFAQAARLPPGVVQQVPAGYDVLGSALVRPGAAREFYVVALGVHGEKPGPFRAEPAAARPVLLFARQVGGGYREVGRNDRVVLRADQGGQCDPFLDAGGVIAATGRYFTVENRVACGQHWTDFVTFRFDAGQDRFVFDNERVQSWSLKPSNAPDAEALVPDGPPSVLRGRPVPFAEWQPRR